MSLLADSSPPPKTLGGQLSKSAGFDGYSFSSNCKHPELDASRSFLVHGGAAHPKKPNCLLNSASNVKCSKVNGRKSEWSGNLEKPGRSDGAKYGAAIAAVPLRSVPLTNVEESVTSHGKDDDVGQELANNTEDTVRHQEESWERDSEKLAAIIAEAKEFLNLFDVKYSASKKPPMDTVKQDKGAREKVKAGSVVLQKLDESPPGKRMKVEDTIPEGVQEEKCFGMETKREDNDEEDVCILSPAEWNMFNHKGDGAKASTPKIEKNPEKWSSEKSTGKCRSMVESQGTKIVDLIGSCSIGTKSDQQSEEVPDCELTGTKCREEHQENSFMDLDECSSEQDESVDNFCDDDNAVVVYSDISIKGAINCNNECKHCEHHKELINLQVVGHEQPEGRKVMETRKLFEELYEQILQEHESELREGKCTNAHNKAAARVKEKGMCLSAEKPFGHIPGIEIGDEFQFRAELAVVGLHCQLISGIDYVELDGKKFATSVVNSGRYENKAKGPDILIYSGQGGNPKLSDNAVDQKLERGNLALRNSMEMGYPVRVTYKRKNLMASKTLGMSNERDFVYVYDGLYTVHKYWQERGDESHKLVFKFELHRLPDQPRPHGTNARVGKPTKCMAVCVQNDVSQGKEKFPVRAVNGVDDDLPPPFTYITNIVYPYWFQRIEPIGCSCTNGCSDSQQCPCVLKNGGEIPFNENGAIIRAKPEDVVHECGPKCKCPPSCMNRVSQHGPRYQMEIFKTKSRGWGVRCRDYIPSGGFICEYVGELLRDKEAEQRIGNDEYLFDICHTHDGEDEFALDAAMCGNIGRFINHSCSPNLYAQKVLYDHDDKRMPHIMLFAADDIPPRRELTYDYNYKMDRVCDANGNIRKKHCYCGSPECTGRMY